jgi:cell wall-active antibiotic response 4TMS protein YvqF
MGPVMMITVGLLFLLQTLNIADFHLTWPVMLIVIGVMQVLAHSASLEGHVQPPMVTWVGGQQQPVTPAPPAAPPSSSSGYAPTPGDAGTGGSHV